MNMKMKKLMMMKVMLIFMMLKKTTIITFILIPSLRPSGHIPAATLLSLILCTLFFRAAAFLIFSASGVPLASSLALLNCCIAATSWNFSLLSVRYFHMVLHWFAPFCLTRKCNSQDTADISVPKRNSEIAPCQGLPCTKRLC